MDRPEMGSCEHRQIRWTEPDAIASGPMPSGVLDCERRSNNKLCRLGRALSGVL